MLYSTTEARLKAAQRLEFLMEKLGHIPADVMSYSDVRTTRNFLAMLKDQIMKEDKESNA